MTTMQEIDAVLIQYADSLSPEVISFKIEGALTPAQVRRRIDELLDDPDWLTLVKQDRLITLRMRQIVAKFEDMPLTARVGEVMLQGLRLIGERLDKRAEATEKELNKHYGFEGRVLLDAVQATIQHMRRTLTAAGTITEDEWDAAAVAGLQHAEIVINQAEVESGGSEGATRHA